VARAINKDANGNRARGGGAILSGDVVVTDCVFQGNRVESVSGPGSRVGNDATGGGLICTAAVGAVVSDCQFISNTALSQGNPDGNEALGGGVVCTDATLIDCLFIENSATASSQPPVEQRGEGGAVVAEAGASLSGCTLSGNRATTAGAGVHFRTAGVTTIENSIIAFSTAGGAVSCVSGAAPFLVCTDMFGNAAGDWSGCIAGQLGVHGNFSANPQFCSVANGIYTLDDDSPCAPDNSPGNCGLVGARPVGCGVIGIASEETPAPVPAIRVVPNPVGPAGRIQWASTVAETQSLRLYDPLGRLVLKHELGFLPSGAHEVPWSEVVGNRALRAGVYFTHF
jgi:hypothetical protein